MPRTQIRLAVFTFAVFVVQGCSSESTISAPTQVGETEFAIFDASESIQNGWRQLPLRGKTEYRLIARDGEVSIRAAGKKSASGLIRRVELDTQVCPTLQWQWRVDSLQPSADLRVKEKEDVAASIFLLFGDPGFMTNPAAVPTLRYVWTNSNHKKNEVIDNPYLPGVVRSIVIRNGTTGEWMTERRNMRDDYQSAFGAPPTEMVHAVALFTDNDQTKEPVMAYYRWAKASCSS